MWSMQLFKIVQFILFNFTSYANLSQPPVFEGLDGQDMGSPDKLNKK